MSGMSATRAAATITARLDRLPASRYMWWLVALLSFGMFFEVYELFQTAYLSPGLLRSGIFDKDGKGLFGLTDQAGFAAANFGGLFIGALFFSSLSDRFGRRRIFTLSLLWYTVAMVAMAFQKTLIGVDVCRFIAGVGVGVQTVTGDAFLSELVPKVMRGKAFAFSSFIYHLGVPVVAFLCWLLVPRDLFGIDGWRWVPIISGVGAIVIWWIQAALPESPRWLAQMGRVDEAERVIQTIEASVAAEVKGPLPPPVPPIVIEGARQASFADLWRPPYRRRTIMLSVFSFFQTIGFYGFSNWLPAFFAAKGASITHSLQYSFIIATVYPLGPLVFTRIAGRFEPKWLIVAAATGIAIFGILFSLQTAAVLLIVFGICITLSNGLLGFSHHLYQTELFPTSVRGRAVGFCYSWSRLSIVLTSFMVAFFLQNFGTNGAFAFIAASMLIVVLTIGIFGPRTRGLALEEISH